MIIGNFVNFVYLFKLGTSLTSFIYYIIVFKENITISEKLNYVPKYLNLWYKKWNFVNFVYFKISLKIAIIFNFIL
jgi:hypothetical protein